jgi:hypothetical protein
MVIMPMVVSAECCNFMNDDDNNCVMPEFLMQGSEDGVSHAGLLACVGFQKQQEHIR